MTINLLTAVQDDGLVMCADSMLTLTGPAPFSEGPVVTTFDNAEKIIELGADLPAAAMISGAADINGKLVSSFLRDVSLNIDGDPSSHAHIGVVDKVIATIDKAYKSLVVQLKKEAAAHLSRTDQLDKINDEREQKGFPPLTEVRDEQIGIEGDLNQPGDLVAIIEVPQLTVVVCSYFHATGAAAEELRWPGGHRATIVPDKALSYWGSGGSAVDRLVKGFDLDLIKSHIRAGLSPGTSDDAQNVLDYATNFEVQYVMPTAVDAMPLQDAVEFTEYLGTVASGYDRFKLGQAGVGGPLDILVLRREKRTWIRRKRIPGRLAAG